LEEELDELWAIPQVKKSRAQILETIRHLRRKRKPEEDEYAQKTLKWDPKKRKTAPKASALKPKRRKLKYLQQSPLCN
jgi:hypothetical protein